MRFCCMLVALGLVSVAFSMAKGEVLLMKVQIHAKMQVEMLSGRVCSCFRITLMCQCIFYSPSSNEWRPSTKSSVSAHVTTVSNLDKPGRARFSDIISQHPRPELELQQSCVRTVYFSGRRIRRELQQIGKALASRMASSGFRLPRAAARRCSRLLS